MFSTYTTKCLVHKVRVLWRSTRGIQLDMRETRVRRRRQRHPPWQRQSSIGSSLPRQDDQSHQDRQDYQDPNVLRLQPSLLFASCGEGAWEASGRQVGFGFDALLESCPLARAERISSFFLVTNIFALVVEMLCLCLLPQHKYLLNTTTFLQQTSLDYSKWWPRRAYLK